MELIGMILGALAVLGLLALAGVALVRYRAHRRMDEAVTNAAAAAARRPGLGGGGGPNEPA